MRKKWTKEEEEKLKELYPTTTMEVLSAVFACREYQVYNKAFAMQLKKSDDYLRKHVRVLDPKSGESTRFKKGHRPWNHGCKGLSLGGQETQFKPGHEPHNTKHDGYTRMSKDGYLEMRVKKGKFESVHRLVWKKHFGEIPKGHAIIFKDGNPLNIKISNLECLSRQELMRRNTYLNLPKEYQELIQAKRVLTRVINQRKGEQENE